MTKLLTCVFVFLFTFTSSVNAGYFVKSESGLTIAGSIYSIQDSARKIYSWIEGEGYKGNTTYVDPISGEVYTSDTMLKDGAVDLVTAATISGAFKIGGKVVGKIKNRLNYKTLYRAVKQEKLISIKNTNKFSVVDGIETKYFTTTFKEAEDYAKLANSRWGEKYTIVRTSIPKNKLKDPLISSTIEKGIEAKVLSEDTLKYLTKPKILNEVK